jgi:alpha-tubulin suppressor-like RCC1 family protein
LTDEGTVMCWGQNGDGQCSPPSTLEHVVCISAGGNHTAAVTIDGRVACWGRNNTGQCDVPAGVDNVSNVACGYDFTVALTEHRTVRCWGSNENRLCNVPLGLLDVVAISAGYAHTAALVRGGQVACWGWNECEQCTVPENLQVMMNGDVIGDEYSATQRERFHRLSSLKTFALNKTRRLNREIVEHANILRSKNKALYIRWAMVLYH